MTYLTIGRGTVLRGLAVGLVIVALTYTVAAFARLLFDIPGSFPIDLRLRWVEEQLFVAGTNPQTAGHPDPELPAAHEPMRDAGGGYPPWAYSLGLLFVPPFDWRIVRTYFAVLAAASLIVMGAFAHQQARPATPSVAVISWMLGFASFPVAICVSYGQYAVIVSALLVAVVWLLQQDRAVLAGLTLGLAFVKPQLVALAWLGLLVAGRIRTCILAACVPLAALLVTAAVVDTSILDLLDNWRRETALYYWLSHNPLLPTLTNVLGFELATLVLAASGMAVVVFIVRRPGGVQSPLLIVSVSTIVAMFWTYRRHYDVALMTIPLLTTWMLAVRSGRVSHLAMFLLLGMTLWLPIRHRQWELWIVQWTDLVVWSAAAAFLVRSFREWPQIKSTVSTGSTPEPHARRAHRG